MIGINMEQICEECAQKDKRIAEYAEFAFKSGEHAAQQHKRITELEKELAEFRSDISGVIKQTIDRLSMEKDRLITERDQRITELELLRDAAVFDQLQTTVKLTDHMVAMIALLDQCAHDGRYARTSMATPDCWPDCVACAWARLKGAPPPAGLDQSAAMEPLPHSTPPV